MHLGKLHKLIVKHRKDHSVQETRFIGELIDEARGIRTENEQIITDNKSKSNPYSTIMKNAFVCSEKRSPLSKNYSKLILSQKVERHIFVMDYLKNNISFEGLKQIVLEIINTDHLTINKKNFGFEPDDFSNILILTENNEALSENEKSNIYADYITEYYYYTVKLNVFYYVLAGFDYIIEPFDLSDEYNLNIIRRNCVRSLSAIPYETYMRENSIIVFYDRYFETYLLSGVLHKKNIYNIPMEKKLHFPTIELSDNYIVIFEAASLYIYKSNQPNIYKFIPLPREYAYPMCVKLDDNCLLVFYNSFYFSIDLDSIREKTIDYSNKNPEIFKKIFPINDLKMACEYIQCAPSYQYIYILANNTVYKYSLSNNDVESIVYEPPSEIDLKITRFVVSSSERYIVLIDQYENVFLFDRKESFIVSLINNYISFIEQMNKPIVERSVYRSKIEHIYGCYFSKNDSFLVYSQYKWNIEKNVDEYTTKVLDLSKTIKNAINTTREFHEKSIGLIKGEDSFITIRETCTTNILTKNSVEYRNSELDFKREELIDNDATNI